MGEYEDVTPFDQDAQSIDWEGFDRIQELDATPRAYDWKPVPMEILTVDSFSGAAHRRADAPWLGRCTLILRDQAIDLAAPILAPFGELLPLACETAKLALFNPLHVLDALDENSCDITRFSSSGRIMAIEEYVFHPDMIPERAVFKIPQELTSDVFYTEPVVDDLRRLGLTGLDFTTVWDSSEY